MLAATLAPSASSVRSAAPPPRPPLAGSPSHHRLPVTSIQRGSATQDARSSVSARLRHSSPWYSPLIKIAGKVGRLLHLSLNRTRRAELDEHTHAAEQESGDQHPGGFHAWLLISCLPSRTHSICSYAHCPSKSLTHKLISL